MATQVIKSLYSGNELPKVHLVYKHGDEDYQRGNDTDTIYTSIDSIKETFDQTECFVIVTPGNFLYKFRDNEPGILLFMQQEDESIIQIGTDTSYPSLDHLAPNVREGQMVSVFKNDEEYQEYVTQADEEKYQLALKVLGILASQNFA